MPKEIEIKVELTKDEVPAFLEGLREMGVREKGGPYVEKNILFDFPDRRLTRKEQALRLRTYRRGITITFKGKPEDDERLKIREEVETRVENFELAREILRRLGLEPVFEYVKERQIWIWDTGESLLEISLDFTPAGIFVELEGPPALIEQMAGRLDWTSRPWLRKSYPQIYRERGVGLL